MGRFRDLTGERFGRLLVQRKDGYNKHHQLYWLCECDCGNYKLVLGSLLRNGETQSCGCLHKEVTGNINRKHSLANTPIYSLWNSMIDRCHLPTSHTYNRYGERGISVCERWHNFENFYADMGDKPEGMSLERIDNNGDYCPENVIWATAKQQANNRKSNVVLEHNGKKQTMQQWCDELGLKIGTVWARLNVYGYTVEQALTAGRRVRHAY
jgi:hypothetical protein